MVQKKKPEVFLELSGGSLKIQTDEVVYHIAVSSQAAAVQVQPTPAAVTYQPPVATGTPAPVGEDLAQIDLGAVEAVDTFYRQISEELYHDVGALARKLSVSIKDLSVEPSQLDLAETGQRLESAKDQLVDIVDMTEKATMNIMDMTDKIQSDLEEAQKALGAVGRLEIMNEEERQAYLDEVARLLAGFQTARPLLDQTIVRESETLALLNELAGGLLQAGDASASPPKSLGAAAAQLERRIIFPLNDLFQILYELCANDDVKKHIKAIWNKMEEFDPEKVNAALADDADSFEKDEGFVMVPLEPLFKALFTATANDKFKESIKKLNAARGQLFLDQSLPVEVRYEEVEAAEVLAEAPLAEETAPEPQPEAAPEPEPETEAPPQAAAASEEEIEPAPQTAAPSPQKGDGLAAKLTQLCQQLNDHLEALKAQTRGPLAFEPNLELLEQIKSTVFVHGEPETEVSEALDLSASLVDSILASVNSIVESLSFQDLAGQRIHKIVNLITEFQIELLKVLVAFRSRIKVEKEQPAVPEAEKKKIAQQDIDQMLDKLGLGEVDEEADLTAGPVAGTRLDQGSVDDMLAELGF